MHVLRDDRFDNISGTDQHGRPNDFVPEDILASIKRNGVCLKGTLFTPLDKSTSTQSLNVQVGKSSFCGTMYQRPHASAVLALFQMLMLQMPVHYASDSCASKLITCWAPCRCGSSWTRTSTWCTASPCQA